MALPVVERTGYLGGAIATHAALEPARRRFDRATYEKLRAALALVFGTESMIVFRDVLSLDAETARKVKQWAIRAPVEAALAESAKRAGSAKRERARRRAWAS